jgi:hypothetical protein
MRGAASILTIRAALHFVDAQRMADTGMCPRCNGNTAVYRRYGGCARHGARRVNPSKFHIGVRKMEKTFILLSFVAAMFPTALQTQKAPEVKEIKLNDSLFIRLRNTCATSRTK